MAIHVRERHGLSVRRAARSDLDAVAAVWHESATRMDGAAPDVPPLSALRERVDAELRSGWDLHVAVRRERVVGMLALRPANARLDQLFVSPGEQRKGVGRLLLNLAKALMPAGFTLRMALSNEKAKRFYEKEGLEPLGEGIHPCIGASVRFYGWNGGSGPGAQAVESPH